jgi:phosphoesterase RecJ-like protein
LHLTGKRASVLCDETPSQRFDFLSDAIDKEKLCHSPKIIVTVDVADTDLLGSLKESYPKIDLCIDHHVSNKKYAARTLVDENAGACAEIIWKIIREIAGEQLKPGGKWPSIASAIYAGVSTDTGCFKYSNTTPETHRIAAELMQFGAKTERINYLMFEIKTRERIALEQKAYEKMEYFFGGECALVVLTSDMIDGLDPEDSGAISILPKSINGVKAGVVVKEKVGVWKVSVRSGWPGNSSHGFNSQAVCSALGGGGHAGAAGCTLRGELEAVKKLVLNEIEKQLNKK